MRVGWLGSLLNGQLNLGASYQSKIWMSDFNDYRGLFASGGSFDVPATVNVGLALMLGPKLTLVADFRRIFCGDIDALANPNNITVAQIMNNPDRRLGGGKGLGFGGEDIDVFSFGTQYRLNDRWTPRAGYSHGEVPWKNVNTLFNVLAPATIEQHASVGASYRLDRETSINISYTHAFTHAVQGTSTFTGPQTGYARMQQNMLQVGYARELGI